MTTAAPATESALRARLRERPDDRDARGLLADFLDELDRPLEAATQRVLAWPGDDARRLEFAGVCERLGMAERAEFVRVQVELAKRLADEPKGEGEMWLAGYRSGMHREESVLAAVIGGGCRCVLCLRDRERELLAASAKAGVRLTDACDYWVRREPGHIHEAAVYRLVGTFVRGFVERVVGPAADWLARGDAVLAEHPVAAVRLTTLPELDNFRNAPAIDGVFTRLRGRAVEADWPRDESAASVVGRLLEAEWPGVAFTLPLVDAGVTLATGDAVEHPDGSTTVYTVAGVTSVDPVPPAS